MMTTMTTMMTVRMTSLFLPAIAKPFAKKPWNAETVFMTALTNACPGAKALPLWIACFNVIQTALAGTGLTA